jgi:hypothetical protein
MKKITQLVLMATCLWIGTVWAQSPQKFNYQAVARNAVGDPIANANIGLRLSITDGVVDLYVETFTPTTNALGLFNVEIGNGAVVSGNFTTIDWLNGPKNLKVEMDPNGGTSYTNMGSSQLISVPYALVALKASNMNLGDMNDVSNAAPLTNQVLQWDGSQWVPANIAGGSGDNWGAQSAVTNGTLTGNGTIGSPLGLASQGAANGQALIWNGSAWTPQNLTGDNWGSQTVNTSSVLSGNGTSGSPLTLAQQGATTDQALKWNGIIWTPQNDNGFNLPYTYADNFAGSILDISNANPIGTCVSGTNSSAGTNATGLRGVISATTPGVNSAGVYGQNAGAASINGYGVWGQHNGSGAGVYGSASGSGGQGVVGNGGTGASAIGLNGFAQDGMGVYGSTTGATGIGVLGSGYYGIKGVSASGYAGYFEGRTHIQSNSSAVLPNLFIRETENTDYARLRFDNTTANKFWEIAAINNPTVTSEYFQIWHPSGYLLSLRGDGNLGLGVFNPVQKLDVSGNMQFTGALMPGGLAGTAGKVLQSNGTGTAPTWVSSTNTLFNNTILTDMTGGSFLLSASYQSIPGFSAIPFTITGPSKITVDFQSYLFNGPSGGGNSQVVGRIQILDGSFNVINENAMHRVVSNTNAETINGVHHIYLSSAGTYYVKVILSNDGDTDVTVFGVFGPTSYTQANIQIIPQ